MFSFFIKYDKGVRMWSKELPLCPSESFIRNRNQRTPSEQEINLSPPPILSLSFCFTFGKGINFFFIKWEKLHAENK